MEAVNERSDRQLVDRVTTGSVASFDVLYERHAPAVARYAWGLASSRETAQELVQDTFVTLWRNAGAIEMVGQTVLPWLLVTCRFHAANSHRAESRTTRMLQRLASHESLNADRSPDDSTRWVLEAIDALPAIDREVCLLCLVHGLTYREAGESLNLSESAVGKRLERSRITLRRDHANNR
ncbi:RNA polymerase sigma factor [Aeromicrobium wangtongii]|uniref:RNA polymerase sigma factor n=1 Tax=Aeromicrobium wangtongii TaxID=2969247 RepID=UPI0020182B01|nr:sigma-70 family RNA polymerase sigma factor [Aeromicrobium wangtongii]MCL3819534.1 sigma-70 family RNA polymerase sigma factor [Aeromicrobium wangtongii]